ncbi:quinoprotein relay system zinc metallohydrolase 1 [Mameliella sp. AT18]|uniref:quinoprotein relay system zinc metallohydrolase 1 n=1 Tax=Mameliella sp. AT18 TaxID=3028385 RepID=UPI0008411F62|nr:quinoprotein relay system zinc metallohydrolase 1 [Mameliella sp. AT18]MDD9729432.1 quinoprotein relay system zinc metallohydrolase 1 [Mameliella sp. AT18]ODM46819.1 MBL fold metallo-hydrolase [Ruegeria sp. PBVC088]
MLTRRSALGLLASLPLAPRAFAQSRLSYDLTAKPLADGIWMVEGATDYFSMENGGAIVNITLMKGDSGLILVDTGSSRRYGEALNTLARSLDIRGISTVVNTHHHPDHFFGNQVFADRPIHALGGTRQAALDEGDAFADNMYRLLGDWMRGTEVVPPSDVIAGGDLRLDGRDFLALPLGGHTSADLALMDRRSGTLVAGDLVFYNRAPTTPSADLPRWQQALDALQAAKPALVIPGHGPADPTGDSITQTRDYLSWLDRTLREGARAGLDMVELMETPLPNRFAGMGAQPQEYQRSVAHLFPGIEREELPRGN